MINKIFVRGALALAALTLSFILSACNTPADAGTVKPHNMVNTSAQHDVGGPQSSNAAGPAGSH